VHSRQKIQAGENPEREQKTAQRPPKRRGKGENAETQNSIVTQKPRHPGRKLAGPRQREVQVAGNHPGNSRCAAEKCTVVQAQAEKSKRRQQQ